MKKLLLLAALILLHGSFADMVNGQSGNAFLRWTLPKADVWVSCGSPVFVNCVTDFGVRVYANLTTPGPWQSVAYRPAVSCSSTVTSNCVLASGDYQASVPLNQLGVMPSGTVVRFGVAPRGFDALGNARQPETTYDQQVPAFPMAANLSVAQGVVPPGIPITKTPNPAAPVITNIVSTPSQTSFSLTWTTDTPSTSVANYGAVGGPWSTACTSSDPSTTTAHSASCTGATANTAYGFKVGSQDIYGQTTTSSENFVTTLASGGGGFPDNPVQATVTSTMPSLTGYVEKTVCSSGCDYTTVASALSFFQSSCSTGGIITITAGQTFSSTTPETIPIHSCASRKVVASTATPGASRTSNVTTITTTAVHGYSTNDSIRVTGMADTTFNGDFTITVDTTTTFHYTNTGNNGTSGFGVTYKLPVYWVVIRTSAYASLPAAGTKVDPSAHQQYMPIIVNPSGTTGNAPRFKTATGAAYYFLEGLDVSNTSAATGNSEAVIRVRPTGNLTAQSDQVDHFIISHSYIHSAQTSSSITNGLNFQCQNCAIVDSYIAGFYQPLNFSETRPLGADLGTGPLKYSNNTTVGGTQSIFFGGSNPGTGSVIATAANSGLTRTSNVATVKTTAAHGLTTGNLVRIGGQSNDSTFFADATITVTSTTQFTYANTGSDVGAASAGGGYVLTLPICDGCVISDVTVEKNFFYHPREYHTTDANYIGFNSCIKNTFEIKLGNRFWIYGNVLDTIFASCGQHGNGFVITPTTSSVIGMGGMLSWGKADNIVIEYTWVRHAVTFGLFDRWSGSGGAQDITPYPNRLHYLTIKHTLGSDLSDTTWGAASDTATGFYYYGADENYGGVSSLRPPEPYTVENNTWLAREYGVYATGTGSAKARPSPGATYSSLKYNFMGYPTLASSGFSAQNNSPSATEGSNSITGWLDIGGATSSHSQNVYVGRTCSNYSVYYPNCGTTDAKFFPSTAAGASGDLVCSAGSTCPTSHTISDFALKGTSTLLTACNSGPCGADMSAIATAITGAVPVLANLHTTSGVSPSNGTCTSGMSFTITGTNFVAEAAVIFGNDGVNATVDSISSTSITAHLTSTLTVGAKKLFVRQWGLGQSDIFDGNGGHPLAFTCN